MIVFGLVGQASAKELNWEKLAREVTIDHVVKVVDEYGICTGVVVGTNLVLTAKHCVYDKPIHFENHFGLKADAIPVVGSEECDLALLQGYTFGKQRIPFAFDPPGVGEKVVAVGYDYRHKTQQFASSIVSFVSPAEYFSHLIVTVAHRMGFSGGPLVNSEGKFIGINVAALTKIPTHKAGFGLTEPIDHVVAFLHHAFLGQ